MSFLTERYHSNRVHGRCQSILTRLGFETLAAWYAALLCLHTSPRLARFQRIHSISQRSCVAQATRSAGSRNIPVPRSIIQILTFAPQRIQVHPKSILSKRSMPKIDPFKLPDGRPISNAIEQWGELSDRDFVVAGCAVLDANLTHLLLKRLADLPGIAENFFGLGDSIEGAGASTLSSKADLAALVGLITPEYVRYLKAFMRIRNHFAHRVVMDFWLIT